MTNVAAMTGHGVVGTAEADHEAPREQIAAGELTLPSRVDDLIDLAVPGQVINLLSAPWIAITRVEARRDRRDFFEPITASSQLSIWQSEKVQRLLAEPIGAPVELTMDEAIAIIEESFGIRPDLPTGQEVTRAVRELLGHSIIDRLQRFNG